MLKRSLPNSIDDMTECRDRAGLSPNSKRFSTIGPLEYLQRFKPGMHELFACAIVIFAVSLRIVLTALGWPQTHSDEGTLGLMAMHIAYRGERPIFFYGQNYMGSLEAYIGAAFFSLFEPSVLTLRLGVILLFALFLISTYLLTRLLYSKSMALLTIALLSLGSRVMLNNQLIALGGYAETLFFGSFAFLLAAWLALSYKAVPFQSRWGRYILYGLWGLVVGLGLWSDLIIFPCALMAGLLLVIFCWREMRRWAGMCLLLGFIIGAAPLIFYNMRAAPGQDSLTLLLHLHNAEQGQLAHIPFPLLQGIIQTVWVSIPMTTGAPPLCLASDVELFGHASYRPLPCAMLHISWGLGCIALWLLAVILALLALRRLSSSSSLHTRCLKERQMKVRHMARLLLLASAGLTLLQFVSSPVATVTPGTTRYLIGLLIATPAAIFPLWSGITAIRRSAGRSLTLRIVSLAILLFVSITLLVGAIGIFFEVPAARAGNAQQDALVSDLQRIGVRHMYTDYWTCYRIAFVSREQIICANLDNSLRISPVAHNRYTPYIPIVQADPHAAYVFPVDSYQARAFANDAVISNEAFHRDIFDGYVVYLPVGQT